MRAGRTMGLVVAGVLAAATPTLASAAGGNSYFLVGGGVGDFTNSALNDNFHKAGTWDLRFGGGLRTFLGIEAAYIGSYRTGIHGNGDLLANGLEGVLRLQAPLGGPDLTFEPFAFGGVGWQYLDLRNAPSGAKTTDNIGVVPVGAGLEIDIQRFIVDARFTYRMPWSEDLPLGTNGSKDMKQWDVTANIGWRF